ncbi:uncharacterized protein KY384_001205 [Bacidia gigantensis]|uniref:uncharacterized protein n=1 Tax=Bacidia gigantensis TaxID=2732470 RepID=UPI001D05C213|nr:uncharacterized protein KY384_001205 [Bacidia gigantensis]KAG8534361.1 hypothetical protein KY384_001205 [Bacidia gigantensis]
MTKKRKRTQEPSSSDHQNDNGPSSQSKIDLAYGQRAALPGLDTITASIEVAHDDDDDDGTNAMSYLRMVRSEADALPTLFVAPKPQIAGEEDGEIREEDEDTLLYADYAQGYYSDGAYTARPNPQARLALANGPTHKIADRTEDEDADIHPQVAYATALLARFNSLHHALASPPPSASTASFKTNATTDPTALRLSTSHQTSLHRHHLLKSPPTPLTLSHLPHKTTIFSLQILATLLRPGNLRKKVQARNLGVWGWGLLARCRELGEMGSEEVGVVREVGKRAAWGVRRVLVAEDEEGDGIEEGEEEDGDDDDDDDEMEDVVEEVMRNDEEAGGGDEVLQAAQSRLLASLNFSSPPPPSSSTTKDEAPATSMDDISNEKSEGENEETPKAEMIAMLDMLIMIVADKFGQRDLSGERVVWDEVDFT